MYLSDDTILQGGKYKIVRHISSGGFGNTYEALDVNLDKRVAIKEFFVKDFCSRESDTTLVTIASTAKKPLIEHLKKKFIEEARAIAKMEHDNIVKVQALFEENGTAYYVMDYIDGESLSALLKRRGSLPENKAIAIILKVADALSYMHKQNRFHLDVKPANIMIRKDGKVILIDFGSSKQYAEVDGENTTTLAPCYTTGYAPIEQMGNDVVKFTPATDIYALGATFYKMLTGTTPPSATLMASGEELTPLSASVSERVCNAIMSAMQINKMNRTQSMDEFLQILNTRAEDENTILEECNNANWNTGYKTEADLEKVTEVEKSLQTKNSKKSNKKIIILTCAVIVTLICGFVGLYFCISPTIGKLNYTPTIRTYTVNGVSFQMVEVLGGTFRMGATFEQGLNAGNRERPIHQVTLGNYFMGKTEVTQELWQAVMGSNPSNFKGSRKPVERISWNDCRTFISKLNSLTGKRFRLPTEAEWEFAARGGTMSHGYKYSGNNTLYNVAWYPDNSGFTTHDVGTKSPNELGLYDMSGNVFELCNDLYDNYNSSSQMNPTGPEIGDGVVIRGGGWCMYDWCCRVSYRQYLSPETQGTYLGLRLALSDE